MASSSVVKQDVDRAKQYEQATRYVVKPTCIRRIRQLAEIFGVED